MSETLQALLGLFTLDFQHTVKDVHALLEQHDAQLNSAKGRPPEKLEVFKRLRRSAKRGASFSVPGGWIGIGAFR